VEPLNDAMRRAVAWPGTAEPLDIAVCGARDCHRALRAAAVSILAAETLGEGVVSRTVDE
jgi:hypothetical protein